MIMIVNCIVYYFRVIGMSGKVWNGWNRWVSDKCGFGIFGRSWGLFDGWMIFEVF